MRISDHAVHGDARGPIAAVPKPSRSRDDRIDLLRGLALICVLFDHIPGNSLSNFTLQSLGFSDAAELFVFLSGYSAVIAYGRVFEQHGTKVFLARIALRCGWIYTTHAWLFLATVSIAVLRAFIISSHPNLLVPTVDDGAAVILRGLSLVALPSYLDILPLYLILLAGFPLVFFCLRRGSIITIMISVSIYLLANVFHLNIPNYIDKTSASSWTFNPFAWQLVYVSGVIFAWERQKGNNLFSMPRNYLRLMCWAYILFALIDVRWGDVYFRSLMSDFPSAFFGNEPKSFAAPWRLLHMLALAYLALTSSRLMIMARLKALRPVLASGRNSLQIFAVTCILSLLGRIVFGDVGRGPVVQGLVNAVAMNLMFWLSIEFDRTRRVWSKSPSVTQPLLLRKATPS